MQKILFLILICACFNVRAQEKVNSHKTYTVTEIKAMAVPDTEVTLKFKKQCDKNIWCFHDSLVKQGNPSFCPTINNHWMDVDQGVVGSCFSEIALERKDCSWCDKIVKLDIKSSCKDRCNEKKCKYGDKPVCGQPPMPECMPGLACIQMMPLQKNYSNRCEMELDKAYLVSEGACVDNMVESLKVKSL